jgi:transcription elongation factor SPT4
MISALFQTFEQFENDGCDNCDEFLNLKNNRDNVYDCTSSNFDGMIGACKPEDSWVCKWQRISKLEKHFKLLLFCITPHFKHNFL